MGFQIKTVFHVEPKKTGCNAKTTQYLDSTVWMILKIRRKFKRNHKLQMHIMRITTDFWIQVKIRELSSTIKKIKKSHSKNIFGFGCQKTFIGKANLEVLMETSINKEPYQHGIGSFSKNLGYSNSTLSCCSADNFLVFSKAWKE